MFVDFIEGSLEDFGDSSEDNLEGLEDNLEGLEDNLGGLEDNLEDNLDYTLEDMLVGVGIGNLMQEHLWQLVFVFQQPLLEHNFVEH
jgi:hypothetical protein